MRLLIALISCIAFALSANAQTVEIRSGQHEGFVRLIIDLPARGAVKVDNWSSSSTRRRFLMMVVAVVVMLMYSSCCCLVAVLFVAF